MKGMVKVYFGLLKLGEILNKLKSRGFRASSLPHNLIKDKLTELIEQTFNGEGSFYSACNDNNAFFYF